MKTLNTPADYHKYSPSNRSEFSLKSLLLQRSFFYSLILFVSSSLLLNSCKKDSDDPITKTTTCKVTQLVDGSYSLTFTYNNNRLIQLEEDNVIRTYNYDANGRITHIYWASPSHKDTTYMVYDAQGRRIANLEYYEGELMDSTSFHYNTDGTLSAIYNHYIGEPNYVHRMAVFFTYNNGKLQKIETYYDENEDGVLDLSKMDSEDEYELVVVTLNDIKNPLYGAWIYETDLSVFDEMYASSHMISRVEYSGNSWKGYQSDFTYQTNKHGYPTVVQYKDSDGESGSYSLIYDCK